MEKRSATGIPQAGDWYEGFRQYIFDALAFVKLTRDGASQIERFPGLLEAMHPGKGYTDDPKVLERDRLLFKRSKEASQTAKGIRESDFALLHAHSLMGLWGALEAAVEDLATTRLLEHPELYSEPAFAKIKLPVSMLAASQWDRARAVVLALQREQGADDARGLGQFDKLLKPIGLGGEYAPRLRETFVFAQQYRHLVAHRAGRADAQFLAACPAVDAALGERVTLSGNDFTNITTAMAIFAGILLSRKRVLDGLPPDTRVRDSGTADADWFAAPAGRVAGADCRDAAN